jgi:hypothetical protein
MIWRLGRLGGLDPLDLPSGADEAAICNQDSFPSSSAFSS